MDDYAMKEEHRASYTDDGTVHVNSLREEDLNILMMQLRGIKTKDKTEHGVSFF